MESAGGGTMIKNKVLSNIWGTRTGPTFSFHKEIWILPQCDRPSASTAVLPSLLMPCRELALPVLASLPSHRCSLSWVTAEMLGKGHWPRSVCSIHTRVRKPWVL